MGEDNLKRTIRNYWLIMLCFIVAIILIITYINYLEYTKKLNGPTTEKFEAPTISTISINEQKLGIFINTKDGMTKLIDNSEYISDEHNVTFRFFGEGNIEVVYSNENSPFTCRVPYPIEIAPLKYLKNNYRASNNTRFLNKIEITFPTSAEELYFLKGKDYMFEDVSDEMAEFCDFYKEKFDCEDQLAVRFVYVSHIFVTLYDKVESNIAIATAAMRITSRADWQNDLIITPWLENPQSAPMYIQPITTVEIIDYWQR